MWLRYLVVLLALVITLNSARVLVRRGRAAVTLPGRQRPGVAAAAHRGSLSAGKQDLTTEIGRLPPLPPPPPPPPSPPDAPPESKRVALVITGQLRGFGQHPFDYRNAWLSVKRHVIDAQK